MSDDDFCYHPCNACGHTHGGHVYGYRCLSCECRDRFENEAES